MSAKYYIYRNLHKGGFSVRLRGRVVDYIDEAVCMDVSFKVGLKGRSRAIREGKRNVHAFVVCDMYYKGGRLECQYGKFDKEVTYNPFWAEKKFYDVESGRAINNDAFMCHLKDEKVYIR